MYLGMLFHGWVDELKPGAFDWHSNPAHGSEGRLVDSSDVRYGYELSMGERACKLSSTAVEVDWLQ